MHAHNLSYSLLATISAAAMPVKRSIDSLDDERRKQMKLKSEILSLQKRNLILQNTKLELEIDALKGNNN